MLKIRLSRTGKKHQPHYRIVVAEARSKRGGPTVAQIGHWHPSEEKLVLDRAPYEEWLNKGAKPTEAVKRLIQKSKFKMQNDNVKSKNFEF